MVLNPHPWLGELVPAIVSGIRVEVWQRTVTPAQARGIQSESLWPRPCFFEQFMSDDRSIKEVSHAGRAGHATGKAAPKQAFGEVLKHVKPGEKPAAKPPPLPGQKPPPLPKTAAGKVVSTITGVRTAAVSAHAPHVASTENLAQARSVMNAESGRLREVRSEGQIQNEQRMDARVLDLIVKELSAEHSTDARPAPSAGPGQHSTGRSAVAEPSPAVKTGADQSGNAGLGAAKVDAPAQNAPTAKAEAVAALVERIETFVKSNRPGLALTIGGSLNARVEVERTGPGEVALRVQGTRGPPPPEDLARIREEMKARGLKLSSLSIG